jgi:hypothetical protein
MSAVITASEKGSSPSSSKQAAQVEARLESIERLVKESVQRIEQAYEKSSSTRASQLDEANRKIAELHAQVNQIMGKLGASEKPAKEPESTRNVLASLMNFLKNDRKSTKRSHVLEDPSPQPSSKRFGSGEEAPKQVAASAPSDSRALPSVEKLSQFFDESGEPVFFKISKSDFDDLAQLALKECKQHGATAFSSDPRVPMNVVSYLRALSNFEKAYN